MALLKVLETNEHSCKNKKIVNNHNVADMFVSPFSLRTIFFVL